MIINLFVTCKINDPDLDEIQTNYNLLSEWEVVSSSTQGISEEIISNIYNEAGAIINIESLLIVKNGYLIGEEYFKENNVDKINWIRSGTKSIMSMLIGIAIDKGFINSIEEPIKNYLSNKTNLLDEEKGNIKIKHLLTMTSGFDWDESTVDEFNNWVLADNQIDYLLSRDIVDAPGTRFNYNSAATDLLSVIIEEASGLNTLEFAKQFLFNHLGINNLDWAKHKQGHYDGGAGLLLRARDMAKLGMLMIYKGNNGSDQIISEQWVNDSFVKYSENQYFDYGYLWWLTTVNNTNVYFASGYAGQFIFCIPTKNIIVVGTADFLNNNGRASQQWSDMFNFITTRVIPAII